MNTADIIKYIYDNNNKEALFKLDEESLKQFITSTCNILSEANEFSIYGTYNEHYELDINTQGVINYILKERSEYNATHQI